MEPDEAASGKRRSFAQRVGERGELEFRNFAHRQGLIATKVEEDYGIDFMFQVDLDHQSRDASDIASTFVGACVRATQTTDGTVLLTRRDASNLLNSRSPIVFILVQTADRPVGSAVVHYRLVDDALMSDLQDFFDSERESLSIRPNQCIDESLFQGDLRRLISTGFTEMVRLNHAEAGLRTLLPQTSVEIRRMADGQLTLVTTLDYFSLFDSSEIERERELLHAAFGAEQHFIQRLADLTPRPELAKYLRNLPKPTVLAGFTEELEVTLTVSHLGNDASERFTYRRIGTHFAYVHSSGVSLITSQARKKDGQWVHETELFVDPLVDLPLEDLGQLLDFFALCQGGAVMSVPMGDTQDPTLLDVNEFFPSLVGLGHFVESWRACAGIEGWPARSVALRDANDPEVFNTLSGFAHLINQVESIRSASFLIQTVDDPASPDALSESEVLAELPVIGNLSEQTVVLWLEVASRTLSLNEEVMGMRFDQVVAARAESRMLELKTSQYPEIVLASDGPTLVFRPQRGEGVLAEGLGDLALRWADPDDDS